MCERKFLCSGFLSKIQCQRFFRICGGPLTGTVYLWLDSSICSGLVCFEHSALTTLNKQKNCHVHAHWICHIAACACPLLLTHVQFYTLFWTNKSHASTLFFNILPPTHMFFNLRPVTNFGPVLPAVLKFYAVRLQWGVFIAHHAFYALKNTPHLRQNSRGGVYKKRMEPV